MERLLAAEQKVFEMQDSFSQADNQSMRSSRVDRSSFYEGKQNDSDNDFSGHKFWRNSRNYLP